MLQRITEISFMSTLLFIPLVATTTTELLPSLIAEA
jgi:hypothetical protein